MPSADLLNYRFDQVDQNFKEVKEQLAALVSNFITKEEAQMLKDERDAKIEALRIEHGNALKALTDRLDTQRWYWRAIVTAVLFALAASLGSLFIRGPRL